MRAAAAAVVALAVAAGAVRRRRWELRRSLEILQEQDARQEAEQRDARGWPP